ncbi:hypothetical protein [Maribacter thermophilus]|uniref:hypothetical protein n=1 Tax=Maribacter thermophilus TaxID=1197874 RepID=UPI0006415966|nr:hypothetical protein [Maribacter thermophilus]
MIKFKRIIFICVVVLVHSCGSMALSSYEMSPSHHEPFDVTNNLEIEVLLVEEVSYDSNAINVDYEIKNNSNELFKPDFGKFKVFFSIFTQDGREIGHYKNLYKQIAPNSSIILSEKINLSVYRYKTIKARILVE